MNFENNIKNRICPIRDRECLGRKCAMAVITSPFKSVPMRFWVCGLINCKEVNDSLVYPIDWEKNNEG